MTTRSSADQGSQSPLADAFLLAMVVIAVGLLAWPPILFGSIVRLVLKRRDTPIIVWFLLGLLGLGGLWLMVALLGYVHAFVTMTHALQPSSRWSWGGAVQFALHDLTPLWLESVLITPLCVAVLELVLPKSVEQRLLSQDREEQARDLRAATHAKRKLAHLPEQVNGQAVIGVVIRSSKE